jgi:secondary thiamine-phosphate synthase enzyme
VLQHPSRGARDFFERSPGTCRGRIDSGGQRPSDDGKEGWHRRHRRKHEENPLAERERHIVAINLGSKSGCDNSTQGEQMKSHTHYLWFTTKQRQEIIDVTESVEEQVRHSGVAEGFVLVSAMHITASVFVNDHESGLWSDILRWLEQTIAPWDPGRYRHNETGEDNAAAHLRSLTIGHEVIVPITKGNLDLGPWQRVFYGEWDGQRKKRLIIKVLGE